MFTSAIFRSLRFGGQNLHWIKIGHFQCLCNVEQIKLHIGSHVLMDYIKISRLIPFQYMEPMKSMGILVKLSHPSTHLHILLEMEQIKLHLGVSPWNLEQPFMLDSEFLNWKLMDFHQIMNAYQTY